MALTRQQQQQANKMKYTHMCGAFVVFIIAFPMSMTGYLPLAKTTETELPSTGDKYAFACKWFSLQVAWMLIANINVGKQRIKVALPASGHDHLIEKEKNILQNSLEQSFMSIVAQLTLIASLSSAATIKLVPLINVLWLIGRIAFVYGYPDKRLFGFFLSFYPTLGMVTAATYYVITNQMLGIN